MRINEEEYNDEKKECLFPTQMDITKRMTEPKNGERTNKWEAAAQGICRG